AHPPLHVEKECFALLFAVVADVDPAFPLLRHHPAQRRAPRLLDRRWINRRATSPLGIKMRQLARPRQAPGMCGQDPLLAAKHLALRNHCSASNFAFLPSTTLNTT